MTHFLALVLYSLLVSIVFAALTSDHQETKERIRYGAKVFGYFVLLGLGIAWVLYPLPW
ncbi:MAG: hypothetical protein KF868_07580 [Acidobacteria bacterium]|jgi:hypothetical protein|nr:hypothetical protein [Acidobacteriota bacterium]MCW5967055.1 hypothetical protein [Blastocatellales bacterium]